MLADLLTWIWPALPYLFAAGGCFVLAGGLWLFLARDDQAMPHIPPVDEQATFVIPSPGPPANYHRPAAARIPGATPVLTPQLAAVARHLADVDAAATETTHAIEGLRVIPSPDLGPVCPFCGGPWHAVCPSAPRSAPTEETQVVDLCPLTTQDIVVPFAEPAPAFQATFDHHPRAELGTQELSGSLKRAKEAAA